MAIQQVKAYLDIQSLDQLTQFKGVSGEQVVRAYQVTPRLAESLAKLLNGLVEDHGSYVIAGPRGSGKSHLLTVIRALSVSPSLAEVLSDANLSNLINRIPWEKFFVIELDVASDELLDLMSLLRNELENREHGRLQFSNEEWETSLSNNGIFQMIKSKLPIGYTLVMFIDGLSQTIRANNTLAERIINFIALAAEWFQENKQSLIVALDDDILLESGDKLFNRLKIERIDISNLKDVADRFILKKTDAQRQELSLLYNDVLRVMPQFCWSRDDYIALFPVHPAVLEVAAGLRNYSRSFSLLGFISAAASRALNRRAMNLSSLDELFDNFEFDLRKHDHLTELFAVYDAIVQNAIPTLSSFDDKLWAKIALKALFLFSLAGIPVNITKLAHSVLLYDERDFGAAQRRMGIVINSFINNSSGSIEIVGDRYNPTYQFGSKKRQDPQESLTETISNIADDDCRLSEMLTVWGGSAFFTDWPLKLTSKIRAELTIPWRGTLRQGVLRYGGEIELSHIASSSESDVAIAVEAGDLTDDDINVDELIPIMDALDGEAELSIAAGSGTEEVLSELDWQVSLIEMNSGSVEKPLFCPPTICYWFPSTPSLEDLTLLKKVIALTFNKETLSTHGIDCDQELAQLKPLLQDLFYRIYIINGQFRHPTSSKISVINWPVVPGSTVMEFLTKLMADLLIERYPEHPIFKTELTEYEVLRLAIGFFGGVSASSPTVQAYAESYAFPLGLVTKINSEYRLDVERDSPILAISEIMTLISGSEDQAIPISQIYKKLRGEPFGLQVSAQRLILLALIANWRIELTDDTGKQVLGAPQLSLESEFGQYTRVRVPSNITHSPKILCEWYTLLTAQEEEIDLVSPQGRRQMIEGLIGWQSNWANLSLSSRIEQVPTEVLTTKLWQAVVTCRRYFDSMAYMISSLASEEISLEVCLGRIVNAFNNKEAIYSRAVGDLTTLISFLEWLPFYLESKNYVLAADYTADEQIETERANLIDFLSQAQNMFDEEKRGIYEQNFTNFRSNYIAYYCNLHEKVIGEQTNSKKIQEIISADDWCNFELFSQLSVANTRYYQLALETINSIQEKSCRLPVRDILNQYPCCACSFHLSDVVEPKFTVDTIQTIIREGLNYHRQLLLRYKFQFMMMASTIDEPQRLALEAIWANACNDTKYTMTISSVRTLNKFFSLVKQNLSVLPYLYLKQGKTKTELREEFEHWLEALPDDCGISLDLEETGLSL